MILSYIKRSQLKRLIYPILMLCVVLFLVWRSPVTDYITMKNLDNTTVINSGIAKNTLYARIDTDTLYYSGQDYWEGNSLAGHFYYELANDTCHYYLLKASAGYPAAEKVENLTVTGRVDAFHEETLEELTEGMAQLVDWSKSELKGVSQKYFINQTVYLNKRLFVLMVILILVMIAMMAVLTRTLIYMTVPKLTPTYRNLARYGPPDQILHDVERQIKKNVLLQTKTLILTPGYLAELSEDVSAVIPLEAVLWIYDHAAMRYTLQGKQLSYTLHIVTMKGEEYTLKRKSHKEVQAIYHELTTRYPNFFYGYSREHQEMVRYILKEMKESRD